jgi:hypothetical protein
MTSKLITIKTKREEATTLEEINGLVTLISAIQIWGNKSEIRSSILSVIRSCKFRQLMYSPISGNKTTVSVSKKISKQKEETTKAIRASDLIQISHVQESLVDQRQRAV